MGKQCSCPFNCNQNKEDWIPQNNCSLPLVFRNSLTHQQAIEQSFIIDSSLTNDSLVFKWRQKSQYLVKAYLLDSQNVIIQDKTMKKRRVLVENIRYKISQILLTPSQSSYCLLQCLKGFQEIYYNVGFVNVSPPMIGINKDGKVKVWINEDYRLNFKNGDNYLTQALLLQKGLNFQRQIINKIVEIINQYSESSISDSLKLQNFTSAISQLDGLIKTKQIQYSRKINMHNKQKIKDENHHTLNYSKFSLETSQNTKTI